MNTLFCIFALLTELIFYRMDIATLHIGDYIVLFCPVVAVVLFFVAIWLLGGREWIGSKVAKLLPAAPLQKGDKAHIYLNGRYNRTATISKVVADGVFIYNDKVRLPLDYRGRFYGIGVAQDDGSRLAFLAKRGHYRLIRVAELIRKVFRLIEDENNLNPDYSDDEQLSTDVAEEGEGDEC